MYFNQLNVSIELTQWLELSDLVPFLYKITI